MRIKRGLSYCLRYYGALRPTPISGAIPGRHLPVILVVSDFEPSVSRHTVLFRNHRAGIASINDITNLTLFPSSIHTPSDALCSPSGSFVIPSILTTPYSFVNNFHYSTYMPVIRSHFARPSAVSAKMGKTRGCPIAAPRTGVRRMVFSHSPSVSGFAGAAGHLTDPREDWSR
jgi:hypothetical protein